MLKKPLIGITLDHETQETYSKYPWYALRENYFHAVVESGGMPIGLPYAMGLEEEYAHLIDGLIITGGDFDINPSYYNEKALDTTTCYKENRTAFELEIAQQVLKTGKPILGICGGEQLLNVMMGGSLVQHLDAVGQNVMHQQQAPKHLPSHNITVTPNTLLHRILGTHTCVVNSTHHQAVKMLGKNMVTSAVADDAVIEAIELLNHKFCIGVQWHPEYLSTEWDRRLLEAFIKVCHD